MGFFHGDALSQSMARTTDAIIRNQDAQHNLRTVERIIKDRDDWAITSAANYAEKHALRAALAKFDPDHPLITNKVLQEKIQNAGERVWVLSGGEIEPVGKAGRDYKY